MNSMLVGSRFGLTLGIGQVEVYASAAARAAVLEAERVAQIAVGLPDDAVHRPTRLSELLVDHADRPGIHAVLRDVAEAQAELHALQASAITRLAALQPAHPALPGARPDDGQQGRVDDWVADEVACVLGIGVASASSLVSKQRALVEQLPAVWTALADGRIDVRRAGVLVDTLAHRKHSAGGALPDHLVDDAAHHGLAWIAEGIGPTPLGDRVTGALIAADPADADRRAEKRKTTQNVSTTGTGDGLATFRTDHLDADKATQMQTVVDAMAATLKRNGDRRPIGVLRTEAHHQLITRPGQPLPDDVAAARWNLTLRSDLAYLDDHGPLTTPAPRRTSDPTADPADGTDAPATGDTTEDAADIARSTPGNGSTATNHRVDPADGGPAPDNAGSDVDTVQVDGSHLDEPHRNDRAEPDNVDDRQGPVNDHDRDDGPDDPEDVDQPENLDDTDTDTDTDDADTPVTHAGSGVGAIGGLPVSPVAVAELLARFDALLRTGTTGPVGRNAHGQIQGNVWFEIVDTTGRLRAVTTPTEARAALRRGTGLGPPPPVDRYTPTPAQIRFVKARDQHCRFPGCHRPAEYADLDHVIPYDHRNPHAGGRTCTTNLVCLCRRHHRLKTHAPGWHFAMDPDGTLHVTPPGSPTRTTRPTTLAEADVQATARSQVDALLDLLGPTPSRYRTPTPEQRAARRAAASERARLAAQIDADLDAALARAAAGRPLWPVDDDHPDTFDEAADVDGAGVADEDPPPF